MRTQAVNIADCQSKGECNTDKEKWLLCPVCDNKTKTKIREDTVLKNFPLFCPKCKNQTIISLQNMEIIVINEPDAPTQSR